VPPVTDGLIIAAGMGSRLRALSDCKPLTRVCGISLLELAVRQLAGAGVRRVVVVTGYQADRIEAAIPAIAAGSGVAIETVRVPDWTRPNGLSVRAGAARIAGNYLLVMADHILSGDLLRQLTAESAMDAGVTLAVDRNLGSPLVDPDDATFVRVDANGMIRAIGKHLPDPDAIDCGAFLATPELARAIGEAIDAGLPGSLSDGMQLLADRGRAATVDIGNAWWIDVDDPKSHAQAEQALPMSMAHLFTAGLMRDGGADRSAAA